MGLLRVVPAEVDTSAFARYGAPLIATAVALLIAAALERFMGIWAGYLVALAAVTFSGWYSGTGASIMSVALSVAALGWRSVYAHKALPAAHPAGWANAAVFVSVAAVIVMVGEAMRREEQRLLAAAGELEERVQERTSELDRTNQSLRELTARLLNLQDEERRRIARELHDNAGQALSALAINLSTVADDLGRLVDTVHTVKDSAGLVKQMSDDIRTMSYLLHPPLLDEMGLVSALRLYIDGFVKRSRIAVDFDCAASLGRLSREVETTVFRLVQECLTNILRHSGSATASVRIALTAGQLRVEVRDMGKGISLEQRGQMETGATLGVGIRGMRERIKQLGGTVDIASGGVGTGTRVLAQLPAVATDPIQLAATELPPEIPSSASADA